MQGFDTELLSFRYDDIATYTTTAIDTILMAPITGGKARFTFVVKSLSGTSPTVDFELFHKVEGVLVSLGTFAQATGATSESLIIDMCPRFLFVTATFGGTVTASNIRLHCLRF